MTHVIDPQNVLVGGAGPVGLMMAAELHRHGIACRLIERLAKPAPYCKALGITPRTLEVWDDLGIVNQALAAGLGLLGLTSILNGDVQNAQVSGAALPDGAYGSLTLAQYDAERILAEHLATLGGRIERDIELVELEQLPDVVRATLRHANGKTERVESRYVIGCDGGRSPVRHALGLPFTGDHFEQVFMLADVELDWQLPRGYGYKLARFENGEIRGAAACIPVPGNPRRYRFSTNAPEEMIPENLDAASMPLVDLSETGPTLAQVQEMLDWVFAPGVTASNLQWSSFYRISHRLVSQYRVGRVFLAGDAAHLHPPLGGQGMNTGIQDAYNLAWKLALELQGLAAPDLLDSYHSERHAIGQQVVERTTSRMNRVMQGEVDEQEPMREDSQLFLNYRESPLTSKESAAGQTTILQSGDRAPDVANLRRPHVHHLERLFDLCRGPHHTLVFYTNHPQPEEDCRTFAELAATLRAKYGNRIQSYAVVHADYPATPIEGLAILTDTQAEFARQYDAHRGSLYLIRPDGYVGTRASSPTLDALQDYLRRVFR